jgi:hypothetical protein
MRLSCVCSGSQVTLTTLRVMSRRALLTPGTTLPTLSTSQTQAEQCTPSSTNSTDFSPLGPLWQCRL